MFRSDALYIEMNYIIENLSAQLLTNLQLAVQQLNSAPQSVDDLLLIANSVLHIFESVLS
jgi:hypothetical protein